MTTSSGEQIIQMEEFYVQPNTYNARHNLAKDILTFDSDLSLTPDQKNFPVNSIQDLNIGNENLAGKENRKISDSIKKEKKNLKEQDKALISESLRQKVDQIFRDAKQADPKIGGIETGNNQINSLAFQNPVQPPTRIFTRANFLIDKKLDFRTQGSIPRDQFKEKVELLARSCRRAMDSLPIVDRLNPPDLRTRVKQHFENATKTTEFCAQHEYWTFAESAETAAYVDTCRTNFENYIALLNQVTKAGLFDCNSIENSFITSFQMNSKLDNFVMLLLTLSPNPRHLPSTLPPVIESSYPEQRVRAQVEALLSSVLQQIPQPIKTPPTPKPQILQPLIPTDPPSLIQARALTLGIKEPSNFPEAIKLYKQTPENLEALNALGMMHLLGLGTPRDTNEAASFFRRSAAKGSSIGEVQLGRILEQNGPEGSLQAAELYRRAAEKGDAEGLCCLGYFHEMGGSSTDLVSARQCYTRAAELNNPRAQLNLASMMLRGGAGSQAVEMLRRAVAQGCSKGLVALGRCYLRGDGVGRDEKAARKLFEQAAEAGEPEAFFFLGFLELKEAADRDGSLREGDRIDLTRFLSLEDSSRISLANQLFREAIRRGAATSEPLYFLGLIAERGRGSSSSALRLYIESLEADPRNLKSLARVADFLRTGRGFAEPNPRRAAMIIAAVHADPAEIAALPDVDRRICEALRKTELPPGTLATLFRLDEGVETEEMGKAGWLDRSLGSTGSVYEQPRRIHNTEPLNTLTDAFGSLGSVYELPRRPLNLDTRNNMFGLRDYLFEQVHNRPLQSLNAEPFHLLPDRLGFSSGFTSARAGFGLAGWT